ncbi:CDK5RAP3 family protein [Alkalimarinus sediminis]|uniref:CDK5RAP3 family protein n=1 Tax=Alkalimarinus sediminis TaxID=1632866 RepID=A0A9E8HFZ9_9ALTE|nr:CDK5RAP3 family protein [Alkalimarinus sediminis]UZW73950.1 CDK5RAP3 family protein [Alkalimarinus sediminis]
MHMFETEVEAKKKVTKKDEAEALSLLDREEVRTQLMNDVEAFLNGGGQVTQVDNNVRADPPRKPSMSYGSAPI